MPPACKQLLHCPYLQALFCFIQICALLCSASYAQGSPTQQVAGVVLDEHGAAVEGAILVAWVGNAEFTTHTEAQGQFHLQLPAGPVSIQVRGRYIAKNQSRFNTDANLSALTLTVRYQLPGSQETLVITARANDPSIDRRNNSVYQNTLFNRDDQLLETLDSGINAGQHEGGGKSLEIRRYGFNLDHGGANGGLKILVDDVPQNQGTQGHGQGYLGSLKSLTPELIEAIDLINGPFNAEYGDFSALGVVHIRQKESLDNLATARLQAGSFHAWRSLVAISPRAANCSSFASWEHAYTDGPFQLPLHYTRDNAAANVSRPLSHQQTIGLRGNAGRNNFDSSGQIPLDQVLTGKLSRFGYVDPSDGGKVRNATLSSYYKNNITPNTTLRIDAFLARTLFDLFSNFTFYKNYATHPGYGDGIQQHDSRLNYGVNAQLMYGYKLHGHPALLTTGANLADNWINVDLYHQQDRIIFSSWTLNHVHTLNSAAYAQSGVDLAHLHVDAGLRLDSYRYRVEDRLNTSNAPQLTAALFLQPKFNFVYTPSVRLPLALHLNYGRAATSLDARSIVVKRTAPVASATDFFMLGASHNQAHFSLSTDLFLIDRQHEVVYSADDGTWEEQGPSRSYGWEVKTSLPFNHHLSGNAGLTQISNAFFRGTAPRTYVDAAPHSVANAALALDAWQNVSGSLRYRHISGYWVLNADSQATPAQPYSSATRALAHGFDVVDLSANYKLQHGLVWNLSIDNLGNKRYFETQNLFDSRLTPSSPLEARIHATPGYPIGFTTGLTWRFR